MISLFLLETTTELPFDRFETYFPHISDDVPRDEIKYVTQMLAMRISTDDVKSILYGDQKIDASYYHAKNPESWQDFLGLRSMLTLPSNSRERLRVKLESMDMFELWFTYWMFNSTIPASPDDTMTSKEKVIDRLLEICESRSDFGIFQYVEYQLITTGIRRIHRREYKGLLDVDVIAALE